MTETLLVAITILLVIIWLTLEQILIAVKRDK
jgi:hypothetical protein